MVLFICVRFSDIFTCGLWASLPSPVDQDLSSLAQYLPEYCQRSKAVNTRRKYSYAFDKFCKWCNRYSNVTPLPASDFYVSLYLINLSKQNKSFAIIEEAYYAISWAHQLTGYPNPCKSNLCISVKEGAHRIIGKTVSNKKEAITPDILNKLVHVYGKNNNNLNDIRICCMCLISFAGFLRFSELVNLKRTDIQFFDSHVSLFIEKSKTDVYRDGTHVLISRTHNATCPVAMLEKYLLLSQVSETSDEFLFRSLSFCKKTNSFKLRGNRPLSYTREREILLNALHFIGLDKSKFGLHSLRSGGATAAASAGIHDRLFKKHGRWSSETAKDGYVRENVSEKLSVSRNLGI